MNRAVLITQVANVFGTLLHQHLGDLKMAAIVAVNAANAADHPESCASHDWCDANELMKEALLAVTPGYSGFDIRDQDTVALCNEAWALAMRHGFKHIDIPKE